MGADVFASRPDLLGERSDRILGWSLRDVVAAGPEEALTRTDRAQPALFAVSFALWEAFAEAVAEQPAAAAGHSLGEYTALAAAGVVDFDRGLKLVAARGRAMSDAASAAPSAMAALLGADEATAERVAAARRADGGRLWVANVNSPGQVVLAGGIPDIEWVAENARDLGMRRAVTLNVAGAFHTPFMEPASAALSVALSAARFGLPEFPVYANATAEPIVDPRVQLADQLVSPVKFAAGLRSMGESGIERFVHIGPGDVTAGLARRTLPDAEVLVVSALDDVDAAAERLSVE